MYCVVEQKSYLFCVTFVRPNGVPRNPGVLKEIPLQYKILCFFLNYNFVYAVILRCDFYFLYKRFRLFIVFLHFPYVPALFV